MGRLLNDVANSVMTFVGRPEDRVNPDTSDNTLAFSTPCRKHLVGEIAPGFILSQSLPIVIEFDVGGYLIVSDNIFLVYGEGRTEEEATNDYLLSLVDYYHILANRASEKIENGKLFERLQAYLAHDR